MMEKVEEILNVYHMAFLFCLVMGLVFLFLALFLLFRIFTSEKSAKDVEKASGRVMHRERRGEHGKKT